MQAPPRSRDVGLPPVARAAVGLLLGFAAGALAAFVTPRPEQRSGPADPAALPAP